MSEYFSTLSDYFKIDSSLFSEKKIMNPTLKQDAPLFIDPCLLKDSQYDEFRVEATSEYHNFFQQMVSSIKTAQNLSLIDKEKVYASLWKKFLFTEQKGLCLGYARYNNKGKGIGKNKAKQIFYAAEHLIVQGISNPDVFSLLFVLEDNIGADLISDMTAHIIRNSLYKFTQRIALELNIPTQKCNVGHQKYNLPIHPIEKTPLLLLPYDILSTLPEMSNIDAFFGDFLCIDCSNDEIKMRVNSYISQILHEANENKLTTSKIKKIIRDYVYQTPDAVNILANHITNISGKSYSPSIDELGITNAIRIREFIVSKELVSDEKQPEKIIDLLISKFQSKLSNNNDIKKQLLYNGTQPKKEQAWQALFNVYADMFLEENNLDITPEAQTGRGPVDFKISKGSKERFLIEIKLSTNKKYKQGFEKQLKAYKDATNNVKKVYYLFIELEENDEKRNALIGLKNASNLNAEVIFIDGRLLPSASKL